MKGYRTMPAPKRFAIEPGEVREYTLRGHIVLVGFALSAFAGCSIAGNSSQAADVVACHQVVSANVTDADVQVRLKSEKGQAENLALLVKARYRSSTEEYAKAKEHYTTAQIQFNAFTSTMLDNYVAGRGVDLSSTARDAAESAKKFCNYVGSLPVKGRSAALLVQAAPVLVEIATTLWAFFEDRSREQREAFAATLRPQITWTKWDQISG